MTDIKSRLEASPYSPEVTVLDTGYLVNQTDGDISVLSELTLMPCGKFELRDTLGCGEKVSIDSKHPPRRFL
jgi:hypothetical protein